MDRQAPIRLYLNLSSQSVIIKLQLLFKQCCPVAENRHQRCSRMQRSAAAPLRHNLDSVVSTLVGSQCALDEGETRQVDQISDGCSHGGHCSPRLEFSEKPAVRENRDASWEVLALLDCALYCKTRFDGNGLMTTKIAAKIFCYRWNLL